MYLPTSYGLSKNKKNIKIFLRSFLFFYNLKNHYIAWSCFRNVSLRFGNENISMRILPFPLIQDEHLSDYGERSVHKGLITCLWEVCSGSVGMITDSPDMT